MKRWLFSAVLVLGGLFGVGVGPAAAGDSTAKTSAKVKPFALLQTRSTQHEMADAYLLAYASCYVHPELLGVKDRNDHKKFTETLGEKFHPLGVKRIKYVSDPKTGTEVVVMSTDAAVIVVFRGSEFNDTWAMLKDWLTNTNALLTKTPELGKGVKVHKGFWKAVDGVYDCVLEEVKLQRGFTKKRVYATGHSLGGALALTWAVRMSAEDKGDAVVYTFGAPRAGNFEFRKAARDLDVHRWVNRKDIVPMLPSDRWLGYRHVGQTHNIKEGNKVYFDDDEFRAYRGSASDHHVYRYLEGLHANLPDDVKELMPEPP
jgi:hypothetical protein